MDKMRHYLSIEAYKKLEKAMSEGLAIDRGLADQVAAAMKAWAVERGVTHYTHWFHPLNGATAEKHDSFIDLLPDGDVIESFDGRLLVQQEPDASSFPNGGIRNTFEARGYTAWDPASPAFINNRTLCIPTIFVAYTGEALDFKTPMLKSLAMIDRAAVDICQYFDKDVQRVIATLGWEQEYFLVDESLWAARPDLVLTGRTMMGHESAKNQQLDDHYFGSIPTRVIAFMKDLEYECQQLGIPVKTRHNEVAPNQFELAPVFEETNLANDHNQLLMSTMKVVARRHCFRVLLHEKPFKGINGSGKHLNYSIGNAEVGTLFEPGETPHENAMFLVFLVAAIRGLHKYGGLLRATVAAASNDHRLGANEAPPAIMSMFLGDQLTDILEQFRVGQVRGSKGKRLMNVGVDTLPPLPADPGDRNRTSPFAFTGNRFEFRALGSSMPASASQTALNTIMSDSLDYAATRLEKLSGGDPEKLHAAVGKLIQEIVEEHSAVIFNGDGYSEIWHQEAERRGLPNYRTTPEALMVYTSPDVVDLYSRYNVLSRQELKARQEIYIEQYCKTIRAEANLVIRMGRTIIYPAGLRFQQELLRACLDMRALNREPDTVLLDDIDDTLRKLREGLEHLENNVDMKIEDPVQEAHHKCTVVIPAMNAIRTLADHLETIVPEDLWPLPSYQEMLFVK